MKAHICYIGKLPWRDRIKPVMWALRAVWLTLRGYHLSIHLIPETYDEARDIVARADVEATLQAPGSLKVN